MRVLLLGDNFRSTIAFAKGLKKLGFYIAVAGWNNLPLTHSKYIDNYFCRDLNNSVKDYVDELFDYIKSEFIDYLIPINDEALVILNTYKKMLVENVVIVGLEDENRLEFALNKMKLNDLLVQLGLTAPKTISLKDYIEQKEKEYPKVIKSKYSRVICDNKIITDTAKVLFKNLDYENLKNDINKDFIMAQQYIAGEEIGYNFLSINGDVIMGYFDKQIHGRIGCEASYRKSIAPLREAEEMLKNLVKTIRWNGIGMFDIKMFNEQAYVIELNGRPWSSIELGKRIGMDMIKAFIDSFLLKNQIEQKNQYFVGYRLRNIKMDIKYGLSFLKNWEIINFFYWVLSLFKVLSFKEKIEDNLFEDFRFQFSLYIWHIKNLFK